MAPTRDSMLEAFKDAKGNRSSVGGPFVGASSEESGGGGLARGRGVIVFVAAVGIAFVLGVLVGRQTQPNNEVQAGAGGDGSGAGGDELVSLSDLDTDISPWVDADEEVPDDPPAEGVSPLVDPRNKYTIVAISFTASNTDLAFTNFDHLVAKGLQAFPPFKTQNGVVVVVVGAEPKESGLADALSRLQRLSGPNGQGRPYEDAYTYPIRKLIGTEGGE